VISILHAEWIPGLTPIELRATVATGWNEVRMRFRTGFDRKRAVD
jgi:hypothetical protein